MPQSPSKDLFIVIMESMLFFEFEKKGKLIGEVWSEKREKLHCDCPVGITLNMNFKLESAAKQLANNKDINANNSSLMRQKIDIRKEEVMAIRNRFPTKIPIIVQRFSKETHLPQLDKSKFLVPQEITMSQFLTIIRNRMRISSTQSLYLLVNNRSMISLSMTLAEVYSEYANPDGFLYITYASQEVFGGENTTLSYKSMRFG